MSCVIASYLGFADLSLPNDKVIHFTAFFVLTGLFYWCVDIPNRKLLRIVVFVVCVVIAGIGSEFLQELINPRRQFDLGDIVCNECGSLLALLMSEFYNTRLGARRRQLARFDLEMHQTNADVESSISEGEESNSSSAYEPTDLLSDGSITPGP